MGRDPAENTASSRQRILFVEDDPALRAFLLRYVTEQGYEAEIACDGAEMRDQLARGPFDLVVLDIGLPGRDDGYACARTEGAACMAAFCSCQRVRNP